MRAPSPSVGWRIVAFAFVASGCANANADYRAQHPEAEPLHAAVTHLTSVIVYDIFSPPQASRAYAYASVAAYEAMRPGHSGYRSLAGQLNGLDAVPRPAADSEYYYPLAGVHAFMTVGRALTFSQMRVDSLREALTERMRRQGVPDDVYQRSIAYGDTIAKHVLAWSRQDRFLETRGYPKYTVTSDPGRWVPTPSAYMDAVEPNWGKLRPFILDSANQVRPRPPVPFDTARGSPYFREVLEVYRAGNELTDEQRELVAFWDDNPYVVHVQGHAMFATKKMSPGGHWMSIAGIAARRSGAGIMDAADAYVRTAVALADGFISCWDEKYRSNTMRPETVINAYVDERWQPMLQTPPFPEYTSGHSVISTAAATVLTARFGDRFAFTDTSEAVYGLRPRSFGSFHEAAAEARISRLYGGIHFRSAVDEGAVQGRQIGELIVRTLRTREADAERSIASSR